jgi:hypothetical protein
MRVIPVTDTTQRINKLLAEHGEPPGEIDATEIAMTLIDEDVAEGLYEGCSDELDLAASEYIAAAQRMIDSGW